MLMLMQCKSNYASLTPRVLQPSPLIGISPQDSVRMTFKGKEACHQLSNISDSLRLLNFGVSKRLIWSRHFLILVLCSKIFFVKRIPFIGFHKVLLHWEESKIALSCVLRPRCTKSDTSVY